MKINILGTEYTIRFVPEEEDEALKDYDGYCDETTKEIVVKQYKRGEPDCKKYLELQEQKNHRHEIIHAFLFESGLAENSTWAQEEEMVDWFAKQFPKLVKAFQKCGGNMTDEELLEEIKEIVKTGERAEVAELKEGLVVFRVRREKVKKSAPA